MDADSVAAKYESAAHVAWRPTCCDATVAAHGGNACGTLRRALSGRSTRSSRR